MRHTSRALVTALAGLAVLPLPQTPASASCATPRLSIEGVESGRARPALMVGESVTVLGRGFVDGCDDTGSSSTFGCSGDDGSEPSAPLEDVELVALQGQPTPEQTPLATADAGSAEDDRLGWVTWTFVVPATLTPGPATLTTVGSEALRVRIVPVIPASGGR